MNKFVLSNKILVFIGLISFPLYLWHWPIFSIPRICGFEITMNMAYMLIALSFLLATLSYYTVEKWMRIESFKLNSNFQRKAAILILSNVVIVAFMFDNVITIKPRSDYYSKIDSFRAFVLKPKSYCKEHFEDELCNISDDSREPTVALIGDSHANHLYFGLESLLEKQGENLLVVSKSGTPPISDVTSLRDVPMTLTGAISKVLNNPNIKTVILAGFWSSYVEQTGINVADYRYKNMLKDELNPERTSQSDIFKISFARTLRQIKDHGKNTVVFFDVPTLPFYPLTCAKRPLVEMYLKKDCTFSTEEAFKKEQNYRRLVSRLSKQEPYDFKIVDLFFKICNEKNCSIFNSTGHSLYSDEHHLSAYGSTYLLQNFDVQKWSF